MVQFSRSVVSDSLWPHELQHARPPCPSPTPGVYLNHVHWVSDAIQPSHLLSSPSPSALNLSQHQGLFKWVSSLQQVFDEYCSICRYIPYVLVQLSLSVKSDSLWPHELQHTRPPCPSPTPRVHSNSHPSSRWFHQTISSSVIHFSFCLQSFPPLGSFQMSQFFTSSGQSIGVSASTSVLPMNTQEWSPLGWTGWISFQK